MPCIGAAMAEPSADVEIIRSPERRQIALHFDLWILHALEQVLLASRDGRDEFGHRRLAAQPGTPMASSVRKMVYSHVALREIRQDEGA